KSQMPLLMPRYTAIEMSALDDVRRPPRALVRDAAPPAMTPPERPVAPPAPSQLPPAPAANGPTPCYLNVARVNTRSPPMQLFVVPGEQFSLAGQLLPVDDGSGDVLFSPAPWLWQLRGVHGPLDAPRLLDMAQLTQRLTRDQAQRLLTPTPRHPCINQ